MVSHSLRHYKRKALDMIFRLSDLHPVAKSLASCRPLIAGAALLGAPLILSGCNQQGQASVTGAAVGSNQASNTAQGVSVPSDVARGSLIADAAPSVGAVSRATARPVAIVAVQNGAQVTFSATSPAAGNASLSLPAGGVFTNPFPPAGVPNVMTVKTGCKEAFPSGPRLTGVPEPTPALCLGIGAMGIGLLLCAHQRRRYNI